MLTARLKAKVIPVFLDGMHVWKQACWPVSVSACLACQALAY